MMMMMMMLLMMMLILMMMLFDTAFSLLVAMLKNLCANLNAIHSSGLYQRFVSRDGILDYMQAVCHEIAMRWHRPPAWVDGGGCGAPARMAAPTSDQALGCACYRVCANLLALLCFALPCFATSLFCQALQCLQLSRSFNVFKMSK